MLVLRAKIMILKNPNELLSSWEMPTCCPSVLDMSSPGAFRTLLGHVYTYPNTSLQAPGSLILFKAPRGNQDPCRMQRPWLSFRMEEEWLEHSSRIGETWVQFLLGFQTIQTHSVHLTKVHPNYRAIGYSGEGCFPSFLLNLFHFLWNN